VAAPPDSLSDRTGPSFIGLTGAVAAGKSEALAALGRLGAETLSSDAVVHDLLASGEVRDRLAERWGPAVAPGGEIDRGRVAAIVFESPDELAWLESQLHPLVGTEIARWREQLPSGAELAVVEVPLLFESGLGPAFDATIAVVAGGPERARRAGAGDLAGLEAREGRQLPQDEKATRATYVVANDGTIEELERALSELWPQLVAAAGSPA
jgi:dephospho-CoA kinase